MTQAPLISRVRISGFRSLRDVTIRLTPTTLLIGPNGAGKSNLLSALRMLPLIPTASLSRFVSEQGGASALLHYGPSVTKELEIELDFSAQNETAGYFAKLAYSAGDTLRFATERVSRLPLDSLTATEKLLNSTGQAESVLPEEARQPEAIIEKSVVSLLSGMSSFHFHDTSLTSPLRQNSRSEDDRHLRSDGSNLAAFLFRLRRSEHQPAQAAWNLIHGLVRRVAPFIKVLEPGFVDPDSERSPIRLYWVDERDHRFDVHDLSDGTLRAIALFTALGQPSSSLPKFITIDEPELGLHPAALALLISLVRSVSTRSQILLSTQSPALLDEFRPEDVLVVERHQGESSFRQLSSEALADWLEEYTLSELYDKNLLGGRP